MSAFFGALTCVILYLLVVKINTSPITRFYSVLVALCLAFSKTFWSQSIQVKGGIYTLNTFFIVLIIYLLFTPLEKATEDTGGKPCKVNDALIPSLINSFGKQCSLTGFTRKNLLIIAFIYGISLANHYIILLLLPVFLIYILWESPDIVKSKIILPSLIFILLGLFLYIYLPIRSSSNPPIDWGNPENFRNFIAHIGRFQYKGLELSKKVGISTKLLFIKNIFSQYIQNYGIALFSISIIGLIIGIIKNLKLTILTVLIFLTNTIGLIILLNFKYTMQDIDAFRPYYLPAWMMVSLWIGNIPNALNKTAYKKSFILLISILLVFHLMANFKSNYNRYNFIAYDYPSDILKSITKNNTLYLQDEVDETIFTLSYLKNVVKKRPDIKIIDSYNNIFIPENSTSKLPDYYSTINIEKIKYPVTSDGLIWSINLETKSNPWPLYTGRKLNSIINYREQEVAARYPYFYGLFLINNNQKKEGILELKKSLDMGTQLIWLNNNVGDILRQNKISDEAEIVLNKTIQLDNSYSPAYYNLGLLYIQKQEEEKAIDNFKKAYQYDNTDNDSLEQISKIYQNRGYKHYTAGNIDEAISDYKKASEFIPNNADIYYNIGVIYAQINKKNEAKTYLKKYLDMNPGGKNATTAKQWLETN
ncbi:MAG: hypothetical protein A2539_02060 [Elusimicrobia bacterium RIFOXYD2_FULL_34_15]|nr:MAG: hypothetical protein A2539_02060 [Elusimicrobia bacterium RIFOXYD2_FULL_34_15]